MLSICIPNYNNARYLGGCIQSAISQDYDEKEIVLIDDCSTDDSVQIAEKYSDRIQIFRNNSNMGQAKNTNQCVRLSRGNYVVILHSDDKLLPDFASRLVPILEKHRNVSMVAGERILTNEHGELKKIAPTYDGNYVIPGLEQAKIFMMTSFLPCQVLMRRSVFTKIGGVDERHIVNLDGLLWFKCALEGDVAYVQDPVGVYRHHSEQITAKYNRTLNHMMEYYVTLAAMLEAGKSRQSIRRFFGEAERRVGKLTLRYTVDVIRERNYELAKKYLSLSLVFDPALRENEDFKELDECLRASGQRKRTLVRALLKKKSALRDRGFSYKPPRGSIPLK